MNDILDKEVSFYLAVISAKPKTGNLHQFLTGSEYQNRVKKVRDTQDEAKQKEAKSKLPSYTVSGIFSGNTDNSLIKHSGLICIDIDPKDNPDSENFNQMKELIKAVPFVAYCGLSVRGKGYFAVIPISNPEYHREHFKSLEMDFARCGIKIDPSGVNVSRKRFVSYDNEPYINLNATTYDRIYRKPPTDRKTKKAGIYSGEELAQVEGDVKQVIEAIEITGIDITGDYPQWFKIGCALAHTFGEDGREMFHQVSRFGDTYDQDNTDLKYTECLKTKQVNIGTFFYYAKLSGVDAAADFAETYID